MNPDEANFAKLVILENAIKSIESILNHNLDCFFSCIYGLGIE